MKGGIGRAIVGAALSLGAPCMGADLEQALEFRISEGRVLNAFYRSGPIAAHLLLTSGAEPRVLVAFPAGNSGVGLWFETAARSVQWSLDRVEGITRSDDRGRPMHGIVAHVSLDGSVTVRDAVVGSVRVLRDYQIGGTYPQEVSVAPRSTDTVMRWRRHRLDGAAGYEISITVENGKLESGSKLRLTPAQPGMPLRVRIAALTGETPLTPFAEQHLLNERAADDPRSQQVLSFLAYEEKFLAGSWRFDTYFGRDTLLSLSLLMPVLEPNAVERGLTSVLVRLNREGEVAHEEDIGEFAILRHRRESRRTSDAPIYDYKMIDDDFMLAPVVAEYLGGRDAGRTKAFLEARLPGGEKVGEALARNFVWVVQAARAFADKPKPENLVALKRGAGVGQWRDSEEGLAGGRYAYDVNAVLVPAALRAIAQIVQSGALDAHLNAKQRGTLAVASRAADTWVREAPRLFEVRLDREHAAQSVKSYAASVGVDGRAALAALPASSIVFNAIALDERCAPLPVQHSDGGFALLFRDPAPEEVASILDSAMRPFPAGLLTDAGMVVANPVFANDAVQKQLDRSAYHGTVIWSWQQALMAAGLERQLARQDLPSATLERLRSARQRLWSVIEATRELRASELWSWRFENGRFEPAPFGQTTGDADESNAAQLWSTVYLAIQPPAR